ncbi:hypothetical protein [Neorhizobium sp. T25_27]|uniref:hypothetical protein n=1 Tax=Neorhizobium sp. T25_27 TaxID=2093831 RepID=UPI00197BEE9E|nr:hypothetical protein [Neorhizobium sp. T25_27]
MTEKTPTTPPILFPALAPYQTGFLDSPDGNRIFFALSGNPAVSRMVLDKI